MTDLDKAEALADDDLDAVQGAGKGSFHDRASVELKKKPNADGVIQAETTGNNI